MSTLISKLNSHKFVTVPNKFGPLICESRVWKFMVSWVEQSSTENLQLLHADYCSWLDQGDGAKLSNYPAFAEFIDEFTSDENFGEFGFDGFNAEVFSDVILFLFRD